ncbi:DNA polymerase III delta' subunit [Bdellovibrio bacteriovorus W]|nr:DNA polymerase III delta' subunit [Bdellovibrio bacteriovorus W]
MARILDSVLGHEQIIEKILESFEMGRPGQTNLFVGPSGIGKKKVAMGLAQALLCTESKRACGRCPSCFRMSAGSHEGFMLVEPSGAQIKMDQAKEVIEFLSFKSISGNRVIIIDQAQNLNPQAANSLLKTLEEPPPGTFFYLIAPSVSGLMSTIRSRSKVVQFRPLSAELLAKKVQAPTWALRSAGGSFEKLEQLQEGPEQELRKKSAEILQLFLRDDDFLLSEAWRSEFKDRSQAQRLMSYWVSYAKDAIYLQEEMKTQIQNLDMVNLIKYLAEFEREFLLSLAQKSLEAERAFLAHRDAQLVMEELFVTIRR